MSFLSSLNIGGSALTAQRFRMDIISQNIANSETTRTQNGTPYLRKSVVMQERADNMAFADIMSENSQNAGVKIAGVKQNENEFKMVFNPSHPDADADGYVKYPNIDMVKEMMDMMSAQRSFEANVTTINAVKSMASSALQIGK